MPWIPCSGGTAVVSPGESERPKNTPRFHPKLLRAYEIPNKPVGEGGFGVVYLAKHIKTGEKHAIKVIGAGADSAEVVAHEVAIMQALSKKKSPYIVRILGYEKDQYQHYLVLQACEGGELFDRITDHVFTEVEAASAVEYILKGLKACHDSGICHRDMKPENVLYGTRDIESTLLLTDFGLSCRFKLGKKSITDWCGTTPYMAPEVFLCSKDKSSYSAECDLWSTGVLVYILLTGYMPFDGPERTIEANVLAGRYSMSPSIVGNISEQAKDFLKGLLTVDPAKRLTADAALNHAWIKERTQREPVAVNEEVVQRLKKFAKQSRLEKKVRFLVAQNLTMDEIAKLQSDFAALDTDKTGKLSHQEVQSFLMASKKEHPQYSDISEMILSLDADADGQIDITEFTAAALDVRLLLDDEKLRAVFQHLDLNKDGHLTTAELMAQLEGDPVVYDLVAEGDMDHDGKLTLEEFRTVMKARMRTAKSSIVGTAAAEPGPA
ncbi:kinase-like domain-containing protein [Pavlovales sp. CCMP2436]|nr:kinase-like domain-containing protein [Pavlovales sp. CCMP2436]|mmetsp:Transcript_25044/g.62067  ORF Transcript_25044/g.62067 Transcript_25044/m.62067 type:complete len:494 (+) Transcript_25044:208-1689(+)